MDWLNKSLLLAISINSGAALASNTLDFEQGEHLFRTAGGYGCSTCHGLYAQGGGNAGGNIRGKGLEALNFVLENEPTMQLLGPSLSKNDRRLLAHYVTELGTFNLIEWTIEEDVVSQRGHVRPNVINQLVILNKKFETVGFKLPNTVSDHPFSINPYETKAIKWTPDSSSHLEFNQLNKNFTVQVINELNRDN